MYLSPALYYISKIHPTILYRIIRYYHKYIYTINTCTVRASRLRAIAYPRASAIAYLRAHQNSKCVPPVLIDRAISCDSFKVLAKKAQEELCDNKKGPKILFFDLVTPRHAPGAKFCTTVIYSSLPSIWDATWLRLYKTILDPSGPHPPGLTSRGYIKISNVFSSPHP